MPLAGHLLPDRGQGGLRAVPALPGRALHPVLQVGYPGDPHVRVRAVAHAASGARRRDPRGPSARDLQLAHGGGAG